MRHEKLRFMPIQNITTNHWILSDFDDTEYLFSYREVQKFNINFSVTFREYFYSTLESVTISLIFSGLHYCKSVNTNTKL